MADAADAYPCRRRLPMPSGAGVTSSPVRTCCGVGLPKRRRRLLSLRGYDNFGSSTVVEVVQGGDATSRLEAVLDDGKTAFVPLHHAGPGCFAARVDR